MAVSLRGVRTLLSLMPGPIQRRVAGAAVAAAGLAGLELVGMLALFPVFTILATGGESVVIAGIPVNSDDAPRIAAIALGILVVRALLYLGYRRWWLSVASRAESQLSDDLLRRYAYAPYEFHLSVNSAFLLTKVVAYVRTVCMSGLTGLVSGLAEALLVLALAMAVVIVSPLGGGLAVAYLVVVAAIYALASRERVRKHTNELSTRSGHLQSLLQQTLRGIRELTVFGARDRAISDISRIRSDVTRAQAHLQFMQDTPRVTIEVALYLGAFLSILLMLSSPDEGTSFAVVGMVVVAAFRVLPSLVRLLSYATLTRQGIAVADDLRGSLDEVPVAAGANRSQRGEYRPRGELRLTNIGYAYPSQTQVLENISFAVPFGSYVAVVGESGSGKTTLINLILGLLAPTSGEIWYEGTRVRQGDSAWFQRVAVVPQDVFILDESLLANVVLGRTLRSDRLLWALDAAGLTAVVSGMPEGLETRLGEGGSRLSAGQRQRVGLARALYEEPDILLLDEATSALDGETAATVLASIGRLRGVMTVISVTHRLEATVGCDGVLEVVDAHAKWRGSHDDGP